jgi:hypothetical protein
MWHLTHRPTRRPILTILTLLAIGALVAACAAGAAPEPGGVGGAGGSVVDGRTGVDQGAGGAPPAATAGPAEFTADDSAARDQTLVVKTGTLDLEVKDFDASLARARTAIIGLGGYISGSQMAFDGDRPYASITYRIPAARWDDALAALKGLATKVVGEQTQAVEVTSTVIDLDARIDNLRSTEQALQAIMAKATKIPDILEVQSQLSNVRGQIEQLVAERDHLKDQAAYGTMTVGWTIPLVAVTQAQQGWDAAKIVDEAVAQLVQLGQGLFSIAIWFAIVGLPLLIVGLVLLGIALVVARRLGFGRRPPTEPQAGGAVGA